MPGMCRAPATAISSLPLQRATMKRICACLSSVVVLIMVAGCHAKKEVAPPGAEPPKAAAADETPSEAAPPTGPQTPGEAISSARDYLKADKVDDAAARLAQLQMQGASFDKQQAKDYRQALSEAYDRAIEAAQRGYPKGQTALQLLRAAGPR